MSPLTRSPGYENLTVFVIPEPEQSDVESPIEVPARPPTPAPEITDVAIRALTPKSGS